MLLALVPVVIGLPYTALLPIFATKVLHSGASGFGILMSAPGIGAVFGTLAIASLSNIERKGRLLLAAIFSLGGAGAIRVRRGNPVSIQRRAEAANLCINSRAAPPGMLF